jgi:hypothetical protein
MPQRICVLALSRQFRPADAILLPGTAWGMPYAPEYGLDAWTFQLLSRSHNLRSDRNWCFGRQWNRLNIIFQAISSLRLSRCPRAAVTDLEVKSAAEFATVTARPPAARVVPADWTALAECAGVTGRAAALPEKTPPAAIAAAAKTGALSAIVNLVVNVRMRGRETVKVNFRQGTPMRAQLPPVCLPGRANQPSHCGRGHRPRPSRCVRAGRRFKATT